MELFRSGSPADDDFPDRVAREEYDAMDWDLDPLIQVPRTTLKIPNTLEAGTYSLLITVDTSDPSDAAVFASDRVFIPVVVLP